MSPQPLRIGIVGTGIFATDTHLPAIEQLKDEFKPVSCFNRTKAKAEQFSAKAGIAADKVYDTLDELINDPEVDVVDALVPVQFNLDTIKKAIDAKKPIMIEKPISSNVADAKKIVEISRQTDLPIMICENWLYYKSCDLIKQRLSKIGEIISFTYRSTGPFNRTSKYLSTSWRQHPEHIGGYLSDGGVHQLALLTSVLGEVKSVSSLTKQVRKESGDDDILFSTMRMKDGNNVIGTFTYGSAFGAIEKHGSFIIYGLNGSITLDFTAGRKRSIRVMLGHYADEAKEDEVIEFDEDSSFTSEFSNFYQAVSAKDKSLVISTPEKTFHHLAVVGAILQSSAKDGDHVDVETV